MFEPFKLLGSGQRVTLPASGMSGRVRPGPENIERIREALTWEYPEAGYGECGAARRSDGGLAISSPDSQTDLVHHLRTLLTRRGLVKAISPSRRGVDKSAWNPKELSRVEAESVGKAVFETITETLNRGETVKLPFGKFEVKQHNRPPLRGWFLDRVRVTYKKRKYIQFTPGEGLPGAAIRRRRKRL